MQLIYLNVGLSSVFESQIYSLLVHFSELKLFTQITLLYGYSSKTEIDQVNRLFRQKPIDLIFYKNYPNYPVFNWLQKRSIHTALKKLGPERKDVLIHIRGDLLAWQACQPLKRNKFNLENVLVDIRGAAMEENDEFSSRFKPLKQFKLLNYLKGLSQLHKYYHISTISLKLKEYVQQRINKKDPEPVIISCFAGNIFRYSEKDRLKVRKELGLTERDVLLVFSSGGLAEWQNNQVLSELTGRGLKILNLSKRVIDHPDIISMFLPYEEMPAYLSASDIALILRNESIVNKVSSPVKFSEFVCSGLPVISNGNVLLVSNYINETGYGIIISNPREIDLNLTNKLLDFSRKKIADEGYKRFSINKIANQYIDQYKKMVQK